MICNPYPILCGDKIEKNEMDRSCSSDGEGDTCTGFWLENLRERDHLGDPGVDRKVTLRLIFKR
jgi:hypothetical protein